MAVRMAVMAEGSSCVCTKSERCCLIGWIMKVAHQLVENTKSIKAWVVRMAVMTSWFQECLYKEMVLSYWRDC
jgi:hypothetical protein